MVSQGERKIATQRLKPVGQFGHAEVIGVRQCFQSHTLSVEVKF